MKTTIFKILNLFDESTQAIQDQLNTISVGVRSLEPVTKKSILNITDTSLSHIDQIDNMLIYRSLVHKGYLKDSPFTLEKLCKMLNILRYQNINILKFGIVENNIGTALNYNLVIVLQDDRDIIYSNNVKTLEYMLSNSGTMTDKIVKESEFNANNYNTICLFEYNHIAHSLTYIETENSNYIEEILLSVEDKPVLEEDDIVYPISQDNPQVVYSKPTKSSILDIIKGAPIVKFK